MIRRPRKPSGWGSTTRRPRNPFAPPKAEKRPVMRRLDLEGQLCEAIQSRKLVEIMYDDDVAHRLYAPHAVYHSTKDKVNVSGTQIENPGDPLDRYEPRNFEVGRITSLRVTGTDFQADPRFDRFDPRYKEGIICSV